MIKKSKNKKNGNLPGATSLFTARPCQELFRAAEKKSAAAEERAKISGRGNIGNIITQPLRRAAAAANPAYGAALPGTLADMLDENKCRDFIIAQLHPRDSACPSCGAVINNPAAFRAGRRCVCKACGRWFTALSGTYLQGTQLSYSQILLLSTLSVLTGGITTAGIAAAAGVSVDTVRIWKRRFIASNDKE